MDAVWELLEVEWITALGPAASTVGVLAGPALTAVWAALLWLQPKWFRVRRSGNWADVPLGMVGVPFAMVSISLHLFAAACAVIDAFRGIAATGSGGVGAISYPILKALEPLQRAIIGSLLAVAALIVLQYLQHRRHVAPSRGSSRTLFWWCGALSLLVLALVWSFRGVLHLIFEAADPARMAGAASADIGEISASIASRLVVILLGAAIGAVLLFDAGLRILYEGDDSRFARAFSWASIAVTIAVLVVPALGFRRNLAELEKMAATGVYLRLTLAPETPLR